MNHTKTVIKKHIQLYFNFVSNHFPTKMITKRLNQLLLLLLLWSGNFFICDSAFTRIVQVFIDIVSNNFFG